MHKYSIELEKKEERKEKEKKREKEIGNKKNETTNG